MDVVYGREAVEGDFCSPAAHTHQLAVTPHDADWGKLLISQILQMSHAQWVFRNVSLHDAQEGYLRVQHRQAVLCEVDHLSRMDPRFLPNDDPPVRWTDHGREDHTILATRGRTCNTTASTR